MLIYWDHTLRSSHSCQDYSERLRLRKMGKGEASKLAQSCKHFRHLLFGWRKICCVHLFLAISRVVFPSERKQNETRTSPLCLGWYGGTSWTCGCENKTLHHFLSQRKAHRCTHRGHLSPGSGWSGRRSLCRLRFREDYSIPGPAEKKKKKMCVHICMDVHVGWPIHPCLCLRPYIYWSFASVIVCINLQHVRFIDRRRKRRPSVTHSSSKRSTHSRSNVIHRLLGGFLSNALG